VTLGRPVQRFCFDPALEPRTGTATAPSNRSRCRSGNADSPGSIRCQLSLRQSTQTGGIPAHLVDMYDQQADGSTISRIADGIVEDMLLRQ